MWFAWLWKLISHSIICDLRLSIYSGKWILSSINVLHRQRVLASRISGCLWSKALFHFKTAKLSWKLEWMRKMSAKNKLYLWENLSQWQIFCQRFLIQFFSNFVFALLSKQHEGWLGLASFTASYHASSPPQITIWLASIALWSRECIIETKWKYDVAPEDKQLAFRQMIINFIEVNIYYLVLQIISILYSSQRYFYIISFATYSLDLGYKVLSVAHYLSTEQQWNKSKINAYSIRY